MCSYIGYIGTEFSSFFCVLRSAVYEIRQLLQIEGARRPFFAQIFVDRCKFNHFSVLYTRTQYSFLGGYFLSYDLRSVIIYVYSVAPVLQRLLFIFFKLNDLYINILFIIYNTRSIALLQATVKYHTYYYKANKRRKEMRWMYYYANRAEGQSQREFE